jgi:hypothetical protein
VKRRNPEYNNLLNILFTRLARAGARVTRIILDSEKVQGLPVSERVVDTRYPVDLREVEADEFRRMLGRKIEGMHQAPGAIKGGNAQKRIRLCLEKPVLPTQILASSGEPVPSGDDVEYAPGVTETEREYLRAARLGQGGFREQLMKRWDKGCPVAGIVNADLLVASHIKPWKVCTNSERLDPNNGILLSALMDRLFDRGLITFADNGTMIVSPRLSPTDKQLCGLDGAKEIAFSEKNRQYLAYHRAFRFLSK